MEDLLFQAKQGYTQVQLRFFVVIIVVVVNQKLAYWKYLHNDAILDALARKHPHGMTVLNVLDSDKNWCKHGIIYASD